MYMCSGSAVVWGVLCVVEHVWGVCTVREACVWGVRRVCLCLSLCVHVCVGESLGVCFHVLFDVCVVL